MSRYSYLTTARYRRYTRYRLKRFRRRYRRIRPITRYRFRRRFRTSVLIRARLQVRFTPSSTDFSIQIAPSISSFRELNNFYNLYETYQFISLGVSCIPTANTSDVTLPSLTYVCAPFHKPLSDPNNIVPIANLISLDRARQYPGTRKSFRRYVPCVSMDVRSGDTSVPAVQRFRPIISPQVGFSGDKIPHYCALYSFNVPVNPITYTFTFYASVLFRNQKYLDFN
ncbi:capsid protein [Calfel virus LSF19_cyc102]|nr:capsid protein [Calfel virus LSF19_cyc102]UUG66202.1 capsid protein [Calfel virus LSF22_cyc102]